MLNKGLFTSNSEEWATPRKLFDELNAEFGFTLDPCATPENAKCERYFTKEQDGLSQPWGGTVFCNPPYGRQMPLWIEKAYRECENGTTVVLLIPSRTDTKYFHDYIYGKHEVRFLKGRLHFNESKQSAPFPSMVVVMRPRLVMKNEFSFDHGIVTYKHRFSINRSLDDYEETTLNRCIRMGVQYKYKTMACDKLIAEMQITYKDEDGKLHCLCEDLHDFTFSIKHKGDMQIDL